MKKDFTPRLWLWWLVLVLVITLSVLLSKKLPSLHFDIEPPQPGFYTVLSFADGDTFDVDMNGKRETIRMIGVDTPETHKPDSPKQCFGQEASDYTRQLIGTQRVRLEADPLNTNRDRYDRLLRYVYLPDGTLVEDKLISEGYGFAYTQFPFTKAADFSAEENEAKAAGKGLWSACQIEIEASGREQTNPLR